MAKCEHPDFNVFADINRIIDIGAFVADVRISCKDCGLPFEFIGVSAGLSYEKPMASVTAQEIHLPIKPKGSKLMPAVAGFEVRAQ